MEQNNENNKLTIQYEDLILVASGEMENGSPSSIAAVVIDKKNDAGEQIADMQAVLNGAVLNLFASGGCMVVQADFPKENGFEYNKAIDVLSAYLEHSQEENYLKNHGFGMTVVPMVFEGKITIVLQDLVYFTGFDLPNYEKRLILCFNDLMTEVIQTGDEIDYNDIELMVRSQIQREQRQLEDELKAVTDELEEIKKQNPYQQMVQEKLKHSKKEEEKERPSIFTDSWMRSSNDGEE